MKHRFGLAPDLTPEQPAEPNSGLLVVPLAVIVGAQLLLLARASEKRQRLFAAAFVLVTLIVCVTKF